MNNDNGGYIKIILAGAALAALVGIIILVNMGGGGFSGGWNWNGKTESDINIRNNYTNSGLEYNGEDSDKKKTDSNDKDDKDKSTSNTANKNENTTTGEKGTTNNKGNNDYTNGTDKTDGTGSSVKKYDDLPPSERFKNESLFNLLLGESTIDFDIEKNQFDQLEYTDDYISDYGAGNNAFYLEKAHSEGEFIYFECLDFIEQANTFIYAYEVKLKDGSTAARLMAHNYETGEYQVIFSEQTAPKSKISMPYAAGEQSIFAQKINTNGASSTSFGYSANAADGKYFVYYRGSCYFYKWNGSAYELFRYIDASPLISDSYKKIKDKYSGAEPFKQIIINGVTVTGTYSKVYISATATSNVIDADKFDADMGELSDTEDWNSFFGEGNNAASDMMNKFFGNGAEDEEDSEDVVNSSKSNIYQSSHMDTDKSLIDNIEKEIDEKQDEIKQGEFNYMLEFTIDNLDQSNAIIGYYDDENYVISYKDGKRTVTFDNVYCMINGIRSAVYDSENKPLQSIYSGMDISGCYVINGSTVTALSGTISSIYDSQSTLSAYFSDLSCMTAYSSMMFRVGDETFPMESTQWKNDVVLFTEDSEIASNPFYMNANYILNSAGNTAKPFIYSPDSDESVYGVMQSSADGNKILVITSNNIYLLTNGSLINGYWTLGAGNGNTVIPLSAVSGAVDINRLSSDDEQQSEVSTKMELDVGNGDTVSLDLTDILDTDDETTDNGKSSAKNSALNIKGYNKYVNKEGQMDFTDSAKKMQGISKDVYGSSGISVKDNEITIDNVNIEAPNIYLKPENIMFMGDNTFIITSTDIGIVKCSVSDGSVSALKMTNNAYFRTWKLKGESQYISIGFNKDDGSYSSMDMPFAKAITYTMHSADKQIEYNKIEKLVYEAAKGAIDGFSLELSKYKSQEVELDRYYTDTQKNYITACVFSKMTTGDTAPSDWARLSKAATARVEYLLEEFKAKKDELNSEYTQFMKMLAEYSDEIYNYCNGKSAKAILSSDKDGTNISGMIKEYLNLKGSAADSQRQQIISKLKTERNIKEIISGAEQKCKKYGSTRAETSSAALNFANAAKTAASREMLLYQRSLLSSSNVSGSIKDGDLIDYENQIAVQQETLINYFANGLVQTGESAEICLSLINKGMSGMASYISNARNILIEINANQADNDDYNNFSDNIKHLKDMISQNINSGSMHSVFCANAKSIGYSDDFKLAVEYFKTAYAKKLELWKIENGVPSSANASGLKSEINAAQISADMQLENIRNSVFGKK